MCVFASFEVRTLGFVKHLLVSLLLSNDILISVAFSRFSGCRSSRHFMDLLSLLPGILVVL